MSLLGFGTVGRALARRLVDTPGVHVVSVTDSRGTAADPAGLDLRALLARKEQEGLVGGERGRGAAWAVEHVDSDVVVDLLPTDLRTGEPSRRLALAALREGRHVVTASKGGLALHGRELRQAAQLAQREVRGSASVAGSTPVLELLDHAFRGDRLERFDAVLNGSTNFVLSRLEQGARWETALSEARAKGILEADPSLDLSGMDAAAKAVILAQRAWDLDASLADARVEGVLGVTAREAQEARAGGFAVRLVAHASPERGVAVAPVALPADHPLVTDGVENVVRLRLRDAGGVILRGPGAGGTQTAAAVLSDILSLPAGSGARLPERPAPRRSVPV